MTRRWVSFNKQHKQTLSLLKNYFKLRITDQWIFFGQSGSCYQVLVVYLFLLVQQRLENPWINIILAVTVAGKSLSESRAGQPELCSSAIHRHHNCIPDRPCSILASSNAAKSNLHFSLYPRRCRYHYVELLCQPADESQQFLHYPTVINLDSCPQKFLKKVPLHTNESFWSLCELSLLTHIIGTSPTDR